MIPITYSIIYKNNRAYVHYVRFAISTLQLQQMQRVITNLEKARLCDL